MPQGPSTNPFEMWLKSVSLGNGLVSGGQGANVQKINLVPGFSFNDTGLMAAGEILGAGSWPHAVVWGPATASWSIQAGFPATSLATLPIKAILSGVPTQIASITFAAGASIGNLVIPSAYTLPPSTVFELLAPAPADPILANISGTVYLALDQQT